MNVKSIAIVACGLVLAAGVIFNATSQGTQGTSKEALSHPVIEYATVRFMTEKTSIVWPDGSVENVMATSGKTKFDDWGEKYPKGSDYRMYWLTVAMNIMGKRGFEFVHMDGPDVVMKRQVSR
jgi:hypothetical protein